MRGPGRGGDIHLDFAGASSPLLGPALLDDSEDKTSEQEETGLISSESCRPPSQMSSTSYSHDLTLLSSSPTPATCSDEECVPSFGPRSTDMLLTLLSTALHASPGSHALATRSGNFIELSKIAPAVFMPGFAETLATRAPFITRLATSLTDLRADTLTQREDTSALQNRLWNNMMQELVTKCSRNRLDHSTSLRNHMTSIDQQTDDNDHALIDSSSECGSMLASSDGDLLEAHMIDTDYSTAHHDLL